MNLEVEGVSCKLVVNGVVADPIQPEIRLLLRQASLQGKDVEVNLATTDYLSPGFFGQMLMLKKQLDKQGLSLKFTGLKPGMRKLFNWNGLTYLIR